MALTAARAQHVCRRRMLSAAAARTLYRCKLRIFCGHFDVRSAWLSMQVAVYTARVRINCVICVRSGRAACSEPQLCTLNPRTSVVKYIHFGQKHTADAHTAASASSVGQPQERKIGARRFARLKLLHRF